MASVLISRPIHAKSQWELANVRVVPIPRLESRRLWEETENWDSECQESACSTCFEERLLCVLEQLKKSERNWRMRSRVAPDRAHKPDQFKDWKPL